MVVILQIQHGGADDINLCRCHLVQSIASRGGSRRQHPGWEVCLWEGNAAALALVYTMYSRTGHFSKHKFILSLHLMNHEI
jgi:hypothetical protein